MKLHSAHRITSSRRGAALLLTVLVLFVLITIVTQISIGTMTDARIGRNDVGLTLLDRAIGAGQYDVFEMLKSDGEADAEADEGGGDPSMAAAAGAMGGEEGEEAPPPCDSRKDEWALPQRTEINQIEMRILVEAENAKFNVLTMLSEDEELAEEALHRVSRIIDLYREGTLFDISTRDAEEMVREMKEHMLDRQRSNWARPALLTEDEEREGLVMPLAMREFLVLESFRPEMFRSFRDENDDRVHSLDQFLTVWSSPGTQSSMQSGRDAAGATEPPGTPDGSEGEGGADPEADPSADDSDPGASDDPTGGAGTGAAASGPTGYGVNVNLAPAAVLRSLFDDREVSRRFWDDLIEYRNLEEEEEETNEEAEPMFDQFNNEILDRRVFETLEELSEVSSWEDNDTDVREEIQALLDTQSNVFTIYITARRDTSSGGSFEISSDPRERARQEEEPSGVLVRTVRIVVWRRATDDGVEIVPIVPWEVLDYSPYHIEDYPEDRY